MVRGGHSNYLTTENVMEKYGSRIGNRLSELYLPPTSGTDSSQNLSNGFCMLTIDNRNVIKPMRRLQKHTVNTRTEDRLNNIDDSVSTSRTDSSSYSKSSDKSHADSEKDHLPCGKMSFKDKLARLLFQKKHTCCRCKRKSRCCTPNKTFNGIEKHYTCCKCREASKAVKSLFDRKSGGSHIEHSNPSSSSHLSCQQSKQNVTQIPEGNCKDSGYETEASCSTVASAFSKFTASASNQNGVQSTATNNSYSASNRNIKTSKVDEATIKPKPYVSNNCIQINYSNLQVGISGVTTEQSNLLFAGQERPQLRSLQQIKQRNIKEYDGYLPDNYHHNDLRQKDTEHIITDFTKTELSSQNSSRCFGLNLAKFNSSGKNTTGQKICHSCESTSNVFFRLPWDGGWICEDCLDNVH